MAVLALFLWYHLNWIHQRRALIETGEILEVADSLVVAPFPLGLFGERGHEEIYAFAATEDHEPAVQRELASLFPEAEISIEIACPPESFADRDDVLP